ncbi:methyltransferase domain-containing protein [Vagococcus vulneris]|uniref:Methyltransferase domain-containing protein n=1 Tax=Vagococcus vulneris TaxID=1977869 RepID=A0A429ZV83_9ENTE|nr:methyltransferase domain-containing protein [Vagococcus vulneris]RST97668.1 hypothetical protein CBF37_09345 [Vagococcus vulneris]
MLKKKIAYAQDFLREHDQLFECPKCHQSMTLIDGQSLGCDNKHHYNLSKKGTIHFPDHHMSSDYDKEMLEHRRMMIQAGLYEPILDQIKSVIGNDDSRVIVDMGCGEGSFLEELSKKINSSDILIGFDLSKEGVLLASDYAERAFWFIGDVTAVPLKQQSADYLLNIFSPSHYEEMTRILKDDGLVIKVIPEENYLKEMRLLFYKDNEEKQNYSNEKIYNKFQNKMKVVSEKRITYSFPITADDYEHVLKMSPLMWGASELSKEYALVHPFTEITIDVKILIGRKA